MSFTQTNFPLSFLVFQPIATTSEPQLTRAGLCKNENLGEWTWENCWNLRVCRRLEKRRKVERKHENTWSGNANVFTAFIKGGNSYKEFENEELYNNPCRFKSS